MTRAFLVIVLAAVSTTMGCDPFGGTDDPLFTSSEPWRTVPLNPDPILGEQRIAVIMARSANMEPFANDAARYRTFLFRPDSSVASYIREVSKHQASLTGDVFGPYHLPDDVVCTSSQVDSNTALRTAMIAAADTDVNFQDYDEIVFVYPELVQDRCLFRVRDAAVPVPFDSEDGPASARMVQIMDTEVLDLETAFQLETAIRLFVRPLLGSFGIGPSGGYYCTDGTHLNAEACELIGNALPLDIMGASFTLNNPLMLAREWLGWWDESEILTATTSGIYVLRPENDSGSGAKALRIPLDTSLQLNSTSLSRMVDVNELYMEYRVLSPTQKGVVLYAGAERQRRILSFGETERELAIFGFDAHRDPDPTDDYFERLRGFEDSPFREGDRFDVGVDGIRLEVVDERSDGSVHIRVSR